MPFRTLASCPSAATAQLQGALGREPGKAFCGGLEGFEELRVCDGVMGDGSGEGEKGLGVGVGGRWDRVCRCRRGSGVRSGGDVICRGFGGNSEFGGGTGAGFGRECLVGC
jgi:hypothetical protein